MGKNKKGNKSKNKINKNTTNPKELKVIFISRLFYVH